MDIVIKEEIENSSSSEPDPSLDFGSESFDPLKALYTTKSLTDVKHVKTYDNLALFEAALKKFGVMEVGKRQKHKLLSEKKTPAIDTSDKLSELPHRRFLPHQKMIQGPGALRPKHFRNVYSKLIEFQGPLGALRQFMQEKKRIKVYTRKEHGIRGVTTGFLTVFDKHWNLVLLDACESWKRRKFKFSDNKIANGEPKDCSEKLKKLGIKIPEIEVTSLNRKYVQCTRKVQQLLIRGEQIVLLTEDKGN